MTDTTALLNGQAGIDVANQVFANVAAPDRFANGVALIETAAADGAVSPVRSLLSFADRLNQLDGDSSHFTAIGVEIAGLVASGGLGAAVAMADFLPAASVLSQTIESARRADVILCGNDQETHPARAESGRS